MGIRSPVFKTARQEIKDFLKIGGEKVRANRTIKAEIPIYLHEENAVLQIQEEWLYKHIVWDEDNVIILVEQTEYGIGLEFFKDLWNYIDWVKDNRTSEVYQTEEFKAFKKDYLNQ